MKRNDLPSIGWREILKSSRTKALLIFCAVGMMVLVFYLPIFYQEVLEPKHGIRMNDVVLHCFTPINWSIPIFTLIYLSIAQTFFSIVRQPMEFLLALSTYLAVNLLRIVSMYLLTFEPPADMILLVDPITSHFYPDGGFAKDLFFSGHISTMTLMVLLEKNKLWRMIKIGVTLIVALFLIWQHVHYALDVVVAPLVTMVVFHSIRFYLKASPQG